MFFACLVLLVNRGFNQRESERGKGVVISGHWILFFSVLFKATPTAYEASYVRGLIGAVAASLCHSHSNATSEPRLRPTPQLTATPDP